MNAPLDRRGFVLRLEDISGPDAYTNGIRQIVFASGQ